MIRAALSAVAFAMTADDLGSGAAAPMSMRVVSSRTDAVTAPTSSSTLR